MPVRVEIVGVGVEGGVPFGVLSLLPHFDVAEGGDEDDEDDDA